MIFSVVIMPPICICYASYLYSNDTCIFYQQEDAKKPESASNKEFSSLCQLVVKNKYRKKALFKGPQEKKLQTKILVLTK